MNRLMIAPSMMCVSQWKDASEVLVQLEACGAEWLHADVMDGVFVPNLMLGTEAVRQLRRMSRIPLDIHLMIDRPEEKLEWFDIQPGELVSVHVESTKHLQRTLAIIRSMGARPMAAVNPGTPLCMVEEVLGDVDGILVMTVNPGFAGQKLVPHTLDKIARLRALLDAAGRRKAMIEVDGNVSFENAPKMRAAGADVLVCGTSSLFDGSGTVMQNAARLRRCAQSGEDR